ncbi:MAG TPA: glycosyltransferase [Casimicrobiaceae bacterium]
MVEQKAGRVRDAERLYREVIEHAPRTHDALHMLGVVRLGLGDLIEAERLIRQAMTLRPAYAAIAKNLSIVERSLAARDRRGIETVSEQALELLMESLAGRRSTAQPRAAVSQSTAREGREPSRMPLPLHVVAPAFDVMSDATWLVRRLRHLLAPLRVTFWNASEASAGGEWARLDTKRIDVAAGHYPRGGGVMLAGVEDESDLWLRESLDPVLVFVQRASPAVLLERLRRIAADGVRSLRLVFDSHARARHFGDGHLVVPPAIDIAQWPSHGGTDPFQQGTLRIAACGQDRLAINAPRDANWLRAIAEAAGRLDLFDPGPLREAVGGSRAVVCIPGDTGSRGKDVARCDLYLHRSMPWWSEDPRMLFGAMLTGTAVLCPRTSVYVEYLNEGIDGWLYDDADDALRIVAMLRHDPERVRVAGEAARRSAFARFEPRSLGAAYMSVVSEWMCEA